MLKDLFLNVTTIIAVVSIGNQILINQDITPSSPLKLRVFFGSMAGLLGILLMLNSVEVMPGIILDFRNIATILSAVYCGFASALITGLIIAVFRLFFYGLTYSSVVSAMAAIVIGIGCAFITKCKAGTLKKWIIMSLFVLVTPSISMAMIINDLALLIRSISIYWTGISLVSVLLYLYVRYLDLSRFLYRKYQIDSAKDHRTGLNNVRQFDNELNKIIRNIAEDSLIALLFMDIDFFKKINDTYGHQNGDKILEDLGKILLSACSHSDIVSRNGGDEFSVLMTDCPGDKVLEVAERIRVKVQDHSFYLIDGQVINITVSIGIAVYPDTVNDINLIVEKADLALYEAKRAGRNRVYLSESKP
ncbi:GGDEF domain-containing protein [Desulfosporosinus youngiae]|uniref:Diguanylate cyclase (GGDEF) domain-containing protein n=1 Tax=Desulfosporosinus youngiae DSM 17734 TaxID=768710 RepID=H5XYU3_9FIRM|nr:diguanylate cyclase [Desulfosporosinus youngiae]EHQ91649.1 diguanylate cyclase (GGDEF) domain-containing protein [Desulfosporosinus youngiae DSM 17734]